LLDLARSGTVRLAVSDSILDEIADVLGRKFGWPQEDIEDAKLQIGGFAQKVTPTVMLDVVKDDPDDNRILECALTAGSEYVITGDKDLLRLGSYSSIRILSVADFLVVARGLEPEL
jgi:uncharacterized protein